MHFASVTEVYAQDGEPADTVSVQSEELNAAFPAIKGDKIAPVYFKPIPKLYYITLPEEEISIETRSDGGFYAEKKIGGYRSGFPVSMSFRNYAEIQRERVKRENWRQFIRESARREETGRGLFDLSVAIPGGRESAFSSIFGTPEVNL